MMLTLAPSVSVRSLYRGAAVLALLAGLTLLADLPLARTYAAAAIPSDLRRVLGWSEVFAHGLGVAVIALVVFVLDPPRRRELPRLLASAALAGLLANAVKLLVGRVRPRYYTLDDGVLGTFLGPLPWWFGTPTDLGYGFAIQSFPSGHTATAVGLAVGLTRLYPRGGWLFFLFAILAAWQRIDAGAHYLSDTIAAASLGLLGAAFASDPRGLGRWFDRWERRGAKKASDDPFR
jgi:membrane-associated phospholipid phosphatase